LFSLFFAAASISVFQHHLKEVQYGPIPFDRHGLVANGHRLCSFYE